jgi:hypothetical protein
MTEAMDRVVNVVQETLRRHSVKLPPSFNPDDELLLGCHQ